MALIWGLMGGAVSYEQGIPVLTLKAAQRVGQHIILDLQGAVLALVVRQ
jgi:hypothetical protein